LQLFSYSHALLSLFAYYTYCLLDKHLSNRVEELCSTVKQVHNILQLHPPENDDNNNEYIFFFHFLAYSVASVSLCLWTTPRHSSDKWSHRHCCCWWDPVGRISLEHVSWERGSIFSRPLIVCVINNIDDDNNNNNNNNESVMSTSFEWISLPSFHPTLNFQHWLLFFKTTMSLCFSLTHSQLEWKRKRDIMRLFIFFALPLDAYFFYSTEFIKKNNADSHIFYGFCSVSVSLLAARGFWIIKTHLIWIMMDKSMHIILKGVINWSKKKRIYDKLKF
jgi:hypothetical protein